MPASGYLAPRPAGEAPACPAITTLTAVVTRSTELRARGLTVHVDRPGLVPALAGAGRLGPEWPEVPVPVATALAHAVREALASVAVLEAEARPLLRGVADATRAAVDVDQTGAGCLEVRWRKQEAA